MKIHYFSLCAALFLAQLLSTVAIQAQHTASQAQRTHKAGPVDARLAKQAEFPGGTDRLITYISHELKYPQKLAKQKIEGKAVVSFNIMPDGHIDSIQILKSPHPLFSEEAIRVIKNMPWWSPAVDTLGNNVTVKYILPLTFQLKASPKTATQHPQK